MELSLVISGLLIIIFSSFLYYYFSSLKPVNSKPIKTVPPPQAGSAWPFIGHLHLMSRGSSARLPHLTLGAMADTYGPIFTIRLGVRRALVVSSAELAKELFTTCDVAVASRPKLAGPRHLGYNMAMFGFAPYGPYWRGVRKLISTELLSARRLELEKHVLVSEMAQSMKELYGAWGRKGGPVMVEMKEWFGNLNLNVLVRMVVGKRCFGSSGGNEEVRRCQRVMRDFFELAGVFVAGDALPYLRWLDIGGFEKKMKETSRELDLLVGQWLQEHRERELSDKREEDFMDVMLSLLHEDDTQNAAENQNWRTSIQSQYDADTVIKSTCSNLISGASDTTTVMLVWSLSLLLNNKHVLTKAQQELDCHIGKERRANISDISQLSYLQAIVKETLRLYPAAPLGGIREFAQDCNIGGYHVPKGTQLFVNLWKLHRDPHMWSDDPLEFRPERFLTVHKDVDIKGRDFELIPFGSGRRICPGVHFALHMLHLVLANLLQGFDFSTPLGDLVDMTQSGGLTNGKATPLHVLISPRLPPTLYQWESNPSSCSY